MGDDIPEEFLAAVLIFFGYAQAFGVFARIVDQLFILFFGIGASRREFRDPFHEGVDLCVFGSDTGVFGDELGAGCIQSGVYAFKLGIEARNFCRIVSDDGI